MKVRGDTNALMVLRSFSKASAKVGRSQAYLASGRRVIGANDDAAGLSIAQRLNSQVRGLAQATRNTMDGISLVRTAEGSLQDIQNILQRGRELAVQAANGTLSKEDKGFVQNELNQLLSEIDRIGRSTTFNGMRLLSKPGADTAGTLLEGLRSGWLAQAEKVIYDNLGLEGDDTIISISLEEGGPAPIWVSGDSSTGTLNDPVIRLNVHDFSEAGGPDGGSGPVYYDRQVAWALTQVILGRNSDFGAMPNWFINGVADFIAGRDEDLKADIARHGQGGVVGAIGTAWANDSLHRSSAYVTVKYLNERLSQSGLTFADFMTELKSLGSLDAALGSTLLIDSATLINEVTLFGGGNAILAMLDLNDSDVGGIGGGDASGVIPNGGSYSLNPLTKFSILWPSSGSNAASEFNLQVGANRQDRLTVQIPQITRWSLGLLGMDVVNRTADAIRTFDVAIDQVSTVRSYLGGVENRLGSAANLNGAAEGSQLAGYSGIIDVDFAYEVSSMVRQQLLVDTGAAVLVHSNTVRKNVVSLLTTAKPPKAVESRFALHGS